MKTTRLFTKTLLIMVVLFGLIANSTALVSGWMLHKNLSREYRAKAVAIAKGIAAFSQDILPWGDASALSSLLQRYADIPGLAYVLVADRDGRVLAQAILPVVPPEVSSLLQDHDQNSPHSASPSTDEPLVSVLKEYIDVSLPMLAGHGGQVHVGMDRQAIRKSILSIFINIQLITLAIFLVSVGVAYLFVSSVARPLTQLTAYARRLAARDFTATVEIESKDEVGMLATTMAAMSRELNEHIEGMRALVDDATSQSRQSLEYLEAVIHNLADGLLVLDPQGRVAQANPACQVLFARPLAEILDTECHELLGVSLDEISIQSGVKGRLELSLPRPQGPVLGLEVAVSLVELNRRPCAICILRDVSAHRLMDAELARARNELEERVAERTAALELANRRLLLEVAERAQAEEDLRHSQERFRSLSDSAPDIIFTLSPAGAITYVNPAWTRLLGHHPGQVLGRPFTDFVQASDVDDWRGDLRRVVGERRTLRDNTRLLIHQEGSPRVFNHSAAPYLDSQGELQGIVGMLKDVTEHRQLEAQLRHAQKMEAVGTLAGGVAHEFNNILMAIKGYTQLLAMHGHSDSAQGDYLNKVDLSCQRAADLTGKMLTFSRLDMGEKCPLQLSSALKGLHQLLRQTLPPRIALEMAFPSRPCWVRANQAQLEQVILNLVLNARDAMPRGGTITMSIDPIQLAPQDSARLGLLPRDYHRLTVADDGPGMTSEVAARVFEPFFTTKEPGKGTGLGLSVAYTIMTGHAGLIEVQSEPGGGSAFTLWIPALSSPAEQRLPPAAEQEPPVGQGQRLLVVDDEPEVRQVMRLALEASGYEVDSAEHGVRALDMFGLAREQDRPYDLVILDLTMPVMDGRECLRCLMEQAPQTRVIMATGHAGDQDESKALLELARAVLLKPFDLRSLLTTVSQALAS